jgi:hypothetical protein
VYRSGSVLAALVRSYTADFCGQNENEKQMPTIGHWNISEEVHWASRIGGVRWIGTITRSDPRSPKNDAENFGDHVMLKNYSEEPSVNCISVVSRDR